MPRASLQQDQLDFERLESMKAKFCVNCGKQMGVEYQFCQVSAHIYNPTSAFHVDIYNVSLDEALLQQIASISSAVNLPLHDINPNVSA